MRSLPSLLYLVLVGCGLTLPDPADDTGEPPARTPAIVDFDLSCNTVAGQWSLSILTDAWSGGGNSYWTVDGAYIEVHRVNAIAFAEDGSSEELLLELAVVSDWRAQVPGSSTAFTCGDAPQVLFRLDDLEGNPNVDCRVFGDPKFWDPLPTPDCTNVWVGQP